MVVVVVVDRVEVRVLCVGGQDEEDVRLRSGDGTQAGVDIGESSSGLVGWLAWGVVVVGVR